MNKLKLLIIENIERSKKIEKLKRQLKQEEQEYEQIQRYIGHEVINYPTNDHHGYRTIKLMIGGKELIVNVNRTGSFSYVKDVISL